MLMIFIYFFVFLFFLIFDFMPLLHSKYKGVAIFYSCIFSISFIMIILTGLGFNVPNPNDFIENIVNLFIR